MTRGKTFFGALGAAALLMLLAPCFISRAQGTLSGSIESSSIFDPGKGGATDGFHSNNYVKLDYRSGRFSAGLQGEWYPDPLPGFSANLKGIGLPGKYISWTESAWSLTAGDFYEQFGTGAILRSWEDRDLGLNNSIGGMRLRGDFLGGGLSVKALGGVPRSGLRYDKSLVWGGDLEVAPLTLLGVESDHGFSLGGSLVGKYEWAPESDMTLLLGAPVPASMLMYSARASYSFGGFSAQAEFIGKGGDFTAVHQASAGDLYVLRPGKALTVEAAFAARGFSASVTYRYLDNMAVRSHRTLGTVDISNTLNYLPALCQQQTYMLATLNPYETYSEGESGFRGDVYYTFKRGTALGGKYGTKLHVGGSWIDALGKVLPLRDKNNLAYRDLNVDIEKRWTSYWKITFFVSIQESSPTHGNRKATNAQNVFVVENLWKLSRGTSLRSELQYLFSHELTRDWMAGLLELGIAPHWSLSVSDMWNHGSTKVHYWNVSAAYAVNSFKVMLGYGHNREGMVCSGGVCRWQPEYEGASLRLQWSF